MSIPVLLGKISDTSPSTATTAASTDIVCGLGGYDSISILAELQGASGGTLDVYLQTAYDDPTDVAVASWTWFDYVHFTQLASGGSAVKYKISPDRSNTIVTIGKGASPVLAAGACAGGHWGNAIRALFVAGASTTVGAVQTITIIGSNARR